VLALALVEHLVVRRDPPATDAPPPSSRSGPGAAWTVGAGQRAGRGKARGTRQFRATIRPAKKQHQRCCSGWATCRAKPRPAVESGPPEDFISIRVYRAVLLLLLFYYYWIMEAEQFEVLRLLISS